MVLQEERQRDIGSHLPHSLPPFQLSESPSPLANAAQNQGPRQRNKLYCTHCHKTSHTIDKCYQLHGFPLGFGRGRGRGFSQEISSNSDRSVHRVHQVESDSACSPFQLPQPPIPVPAPSPTLSTDQCQQLINFLQY